MKKTKREIKIFRSFGKVGTSQLNFSSNFVFIFRLMVSATPPEKSLSAVFSERNSQKKEIDTCLTFSWKAMPLLLTRILWSGFRPQYHSCQKPDNLARHLR
jgi:hypothetical protein